MDIIAVDEYQNKKALLLADLQKQPSPSNHQLQLHKTTSNLFRHRKHHKNKTKLDLRHFNQVIKVDPENLIAEVEGLITFEALVEQTLKYHCLPQIVPELKSITVGGAIAGLAAESSSFKFGIVHETITEMEVLLSHGEVVTCTPDNEHKDLYYALPGSYGTLGYVLKAKIRLIPAKPYVKITRLKFANSKDYFAKIAELITAESHQIDYLDGTCLRDHLYLTLGNFTEHAPYLSNYKYMNIYYQSISNKTEDYLTTADYIWRWDPDWFWCSKYFLMENKFFRFLFGKWMLKSTVYWKIMRFINVHEVIRKFTNWISPQTETIIQDLQIPIEKANEFYDFFKNELKIDPIFICPIKSNPTMNQFLFSQIKKDLIYINFGAYGNFLPSNQPAGYFNRLIEKQATNCQGYKCLYSNVFYTEQEFWNIFDKRTYASLKQKYDPNQLLTDIYVKCSEKIV